MLARDSRVLTYYERKLHADDSIVVPSAVLIECRTGDPRRDAAVERLLKRIHVDERIPDRLARIASVLRTAARRGSAVDALLVAYAVMFAGGGGRVVTGDRQDLEALAQHAENVAIEAI